MWCLWSLVFHVTATGALFFMSRTVQGCSVFFMSPYTDFFMSLSPKCKLIAYPCHSRSGSLFCHAVPVVSAPFSCHRLFRVALPNSIRGRLHLISSGSFASSQHAHCGRENTNLELLTLRLSRRLSRPRCRLRRARDDRYRSLAARVSPYYGHDNGQTLTTRSRLAFFMFGRLRSDSCSRSGSGDRADKPSGQHPLRQQCTE